MLCPIYVATYVFTETKTETYTRNICFECFFLSLLFNDFFATNFLGVFFRFFSFFFSWINSHRSGTTGCANWVYYYVTSYFYNVYLFQLNFKRSSRKRRIFFSSCFIYFFSCIWFKILICDSNLKVNSIWFNFQFFAFLSFQLLTHNVFQISIHLLREIRLREKYQHFIFVFCREFVVIVSRKSRWMR